MSNVCKQLGCRLNRILFCYQLPMVMAPLETGSQSSRKSHSSNSPSVFREIEGDLFSAKRDTSMAHCVSSDMKMGAGIAVHFRLKFGRVDELLNQRKTVGQVAVLEDRQRFIFYLVTKQRYFHKPTENTLHASLLDMRKKCKKLGVTKLAMPRIGCGLDGLKWGLVSHLVHDVFENCGMEITIYSIPDKKQKPVTMTPNLSRTREQFRKFFEPKRPQSLPATVMNSKRKFHYDSSEEDFETPKRRKVMTSSSLAGEDDNLWSPFKKRSSADKNEKRLSNDHRKADLDTEYDSLESESLADALSTFLGVCPFSQSSEKRRSTKSLQSSRSFDSHEYITSTRPATPFLCKGEQDEVNITQNSTPVNKGRKILFASSDEEGISGEEKSRHSPDRESSPPSPRQERRRSLSNTLSKEKHKKERSSSKNGSEEKLKKEKKRSSSKSPSEEKLKKEKRRSSSLSCSEEKLKKEKRKSSKSRSEEKVKKEKRRSSSKSRSEEKVKKEKRRSSSKSRCEEKLKKAQRRSSDNLVSQPVEIVA